MPNLNFIRRLMFCAVLLLIAPICILAQNDNEPPTREIKSLDFQKQRRKKIIKTSNSQTKNNRRTKNLAVVTNANRRYHLVGQTPNRKKSGATAQSKLKSEQLGVTFWRLRPTTGDDDEDVALFPVRLGEKTECWTAERVNSSTVFKTGDRVRLTIESSRTGYLYIVNREIYTDGKTGEATIIFPTLRINSGENAVVAGSLIEIPAATDSVPYFTIKPRRADYAGEELLAIITPEKLPLELGLQAQTVAPEKVSQWLADWGLAADVYDAADGEGIAYTQIEAESANSRALTQEEPLPQTIYRVKARESAPLLISFQIKAIAVKE